MIEHLAIATFFIWGIKAVTEYPFIFYKQANWLNSVLPVWVAKPIYKCPVCMSSVWGTYFFLYSDQRGLINWVIFVFALCGINYLIVEFLYPNHVEISEEEQKKP